MKTISAEYQNIMQSNLAWVQAEPLQFVAIASLCVVLMVWASRQRN